MKIDLTGKTAIVCGGSKGMGFASAKALAASGARVAILARSAETLARAEAELKSINPACIGVRCDVSNADEIESAVRRVSVELGDADILVNNTGGPKPGRIESMTDADWQAAFEALFLSVVRFTRLVVPGMKKRGFGRIINITSILAKSPSPGMGLSNSIRAAVLGFAKTLSREVAEHGITVNSLCPGAVATERLENLMKLDAAEEQVPPDEIKRKMEKGIPVGFIAKPEDFAQAVLFLASQESRYLNGAAIQIDGGEYKGLL